MACKTAGQTAVTDSAAERLRIRLDPKRKVLTKSMDSLNTTKVGLLMCACFANDFDALVEILKKRESSDVNFATRDPVPGFPSGFTALMAAMACARFEITEVLLFADADPNAVSGEPDAGRDALFYSALANRPFNGERWLERFPLWDVNRTDAKGHTPLTLAAKYGATGMVKVLLNARAALSGMPVSALHQCVSSDCGNEETVKLLLKHDGDPNMALPLPEEQVTRRGIWACLPCCTSHMKKMNLEEGGQTALHLALKQCCGTTSIVNVLLQEGGADVTLIDTSGRRALDIARTSFGPESPFEHILSVQTANPANPHTLSTP